MATHCIGASSSLHNKGKRQEDSFLEARNSGLGTCPAGGINRSESKLDWEQILCLRMLHSLLRFSPDDERRNYKKFLRTLPVSLPENLSFTTITGFIRQFSQLRPNAKAYCIFVVDEVCSPSCRNFTFVSAMLIGPQKPFQSYIA